MTLSPSNTIVIADFDGTIIQKVVNGKLISSFASLIQHNVSYFTQQGVDEIHHLTETYYPIERDPSISLPEKSMKMQEWWHQCFDAYKKYRLNRKMITETCNSPLLQLRDGFLEFAHYLSHYHIPLIIYSASGIGVDGISILFEHYHIPTDNIRICSNKLLFDDQGYFTGVQEPIITSTNKTGETLIKHHILPKQPSQRTCLLIGDGIEDIRMVEGLDFDSVYKVAFCLDHEPAYSNRFDLLLPIDGAFTPITALFK